MPWFSELSPLDPAGELIGIETPEEATQSTEKAQHDIELLVKSA